MKDKPIIGDKYYKLTISEILPNGKVMTTCECGVKKSIRWHYVKNGVTKSCGCIKNAFKNYEGEVYGRLIVLERISNKRVMARCQCGIVKDYSIKHLISRHTFSCGCLNKENITKHGLCKHPLYSIWEGMIRRCYNHRFPKFHRYGGRGVTVCAEWRNNFKTFYDWSISNGWEKGLELDKDIKNPTSSEYCPDNCSYVTHKVNVNNRCNSIKIEYNNRLFSVSEWAVLLNMPDKTLRARIDRGWSIGRAFTEPVNKKTA